MKSILLSSALLLTMASLAHADWQSQRTTTGPNGVTSKATTSVTRDGNTRTTRTQVTRSNGTGHTRDVVQTWDPDTKSWTRSVTGQTAKGGVWTNSGSGSCNNGTCSSGSTYVGPQGNTIQSQGTSRFDRNGGERRWNWFSSTGRSGEGTRTWQRLR